MTGRGFYASLACLLIVWLIATVVILALAPPRNRWYELKCKTTSTGSEVCQYEEKTP